ncbi:MAG: pyridoxal phosphate-dependent aminotransferase [Parvibaculaceae bacterium]
MRYASITERVAGLGTDKWAVHYAALKKIAAGERVLMLSIGEPDFAPPEAVSEAMIRSVRTGRVRYSSGRGEPSVLEAIARHYARRTGRDITPAQAVYMPGTQSALGFAILALAEAGDEVIVPEPYYVTYDGVVAATGATQVRAVTRPRDRFHLTPEGLEAAITPRSRVLLLNSPSNPTGAVLSAAELGAIGEVCAAHDLWIVSDEVYSTLVFGNAAFASPFDDARLAERTVVVSSLSKSHAMPGFRAGWAIGPEEFATRMLPCAEAFLFGCQPFVQDATVYALSRDFPECDAMRQAFERRARAVLEAFGKKGAISAHMPEGGMFVFADVRRTGLSGEAFAMRLLEEENVSVMPGEAFGAAGSGHVRIGLVAEDALIADAAARMAKLASRLA